MHASMDRQSLMHEGLAGFDYSSLNMPKECNFSGCAIRSVFNGAVLLLGMIFVNIDHSHSNCNLSKEAVSFGIASLIISPLNMATSCALIIKGDTPAWEVFNAAFATACTIFSIGVFTWHFTTC